MNHILYIFAAAASLVLLVDAIVNDRGAFAFTCYLYATATWLLMILL